MKHLFVALVAATFVLAVSPAFAQEGGTAPAATEAPAAPAPAPTHKMTKHEKKAHHAKKHHNKKKDAAEKM